MRQNWKEHQPPYAHVRPAIAETEEQIREMIIRAALGKK